MNHQRWLDELARYLTSQIPGQPAQSQSPNQTRPPDRPPPSELVAGLFARQLALNPAAASWLAQQGSSPGPVQSMADLPAIPVAAFKALELTTVPPAERVAVYYSSGTTSHQPSRHFHSRATLVIYELALEAWFKRRVLGDLPWSWRTSEPPPEERPTMLSLTPKPADAPHSSLAFMIGRLFDRFGNAASSSFQGRIGTAGWELDLPALRAALQLAADSDRVVVVLGAAFNFVHLLDDLASAGRTLQLPPGSRVMETGGYKGRSREVSKAELHQQITARLNIPRELIIGEYGMSELSSQAYDADRSAFHKPPSAGAFSAAAAGPDEEEQSAVQGTRAHPTLDVATTHATMEDNRVPTIRSLGPSGSSGARRLQFPPWCHVSIVSPETKRVLPRGQPGLLRIADLANVASVLALQTEDLAIEHADGFELLGRAAQAEPRGCSLLPSSGLN